MDRQNVEFYNAHAPDLPQRHAETGSRVAQFFFSLAFLPGTHVLEPGCGSGRELNELDWIRSREGTWTHFELRRRTGESPL